MADQKIIDYTIGRATNDVLEKTVAVWFKDEGDDDGYQRIGPIYLQVGDHPVRDMVVFAKENDSPDVLGVPVEWHTEATARALADELGVEVVWS